MSFDVLQNFSPLLLVIVIHIGSDLEQAGARMEQNLCVKCSWSNSNCNCNSDLGNELTSLQTKDV